MPDPLETPDVAELRRLLDDMRALATREGVYDGNRAVLDIIARVEPLLDDADALRAELAHMTEARDNARAEVERLAAAVRRVWELHRESRSSLSALYPNPICECGKDYPCPTIRAIGSES